MDDLGVRGELGEFAGDPVVESGTDRDDQVGLYYLSLNRLEHYPNGERKRDEVPDLSNNVRVDYSIFGTPYPLSSSTR